MRSIYSYRYDSLLSHIGSMRSQVSSVLIKSIYVTEVAARLASILPHP